MRCRRFPKEHIEKTSLHESEWNFDAVPDAELVACCYWEYARESAFIRDVRQRCIKCWRNGGQPDEHLRTDLNRLYGLGPHIDVLLRGFYHAPNHPRRIDVVRNAYVTNSFPAAWQDLPDDERDFRVRTLLGAGWYPATPFKRADWMETEQIAEDARARWDKIIGVYHRVREKDRETSEVELVRQGKLEP
jgi:hypothetical protein